MVVHLAYLAFIPVGGFLAWRWPRLRWFHLAAIAVAATSVIVGFDCPLTSLEDHFRRAAGEPTYRGGFVDHYLTGRLYPHGYDWLVQLLFVLAIVVSYALRPRVRAAQPLT